MSDPIRIHSLLERIEEAIVLINENTSHIKSADDFLQSSDGMFALSGVCMQLVFIGESAKVISAKAEANYLHQYKNIPWTSIMGLRDIIAHEYHHIDAEEIFKVIKKDLPILLTTIEQMKKDLHQ
jgi:uncharacterized protein with HEPN domain